MAEQTLTTDPVLHTLTRIAQFADDANKPLHRNEMRVDWAQSLGAREQAYIHALRSTLGEITNIARKQIVEIGAACSCERQPGTNPDCPVHQLEPQEDPGDDNSTSQEGLPDSQVISN